MLLKSSRDFLASKLGRSDWTGGNWKTCLETLAGHSPCCGSAIQFWCPFPGSGLLWTERGLGAGPRSTGGHRGLAPPLPGCDLELVTGCLTSNSGLPHTS